MTVEELQDEIQRRASAALKKSMEYINTDIAEHDKHWKEWQKHFHADCVIAEILKEQSQLNHQS